MIIIIMIIIILNHNNELSASCATALGTASRATVARSTFGCEQMGSALMGPLLKQ